MNVPAVVNELPVTRSTAASEIIAPTVDILPIWPATVPIANAPSVTPPITFLLTVLLQRTLLWYEVTVVMRSIQKDS